MARGESRSGEFVIRDLTSGAVDVIEADGLRAGAPGEDPPFGSVPAFPDTPTSAFNRALVTAGGSSQSGAAAAETPAAASWRRALPALASPSARHGERDGDQADGEATGRLGGAPGAFARRQGLGPAAAPFRAGLRASASPGSSLRTVGAGIAARAVRVPASTTSLLNASDSAPASSLGTSLPLSGAGAAIGDALDREIRSSLRGMTKASSGSPTGAATRHDRKVTFLPFCVGCPATISIVENTTVAPESAGRRSESYVVYQVNVMPFGDARLGWTVFRRYRQFFALHKHLQSSGISVGARFPGRDVASVMFDRLFRSGRQTALNTWLTSVVSSGIRSHKVTSFLCCLPDSPPAGMERSPLAIAGRTLPLTGSLSAAETWNSLKVAAQEFGSAKAQRALTKAGHPVSVDEAGEALLTVPSASMALLRVTAARAAEPAPPVGGPASLAKGATGPSPRPGQGSSMPRTLVPPAINTSLPAISGFGAPKSSPGPGRRQQTATVGVAQRFQDSTAYEHAVLHDAADSPSESETRSAGTRSAARIWEHQVTSTRSFITESSPRETVRPCGAASDMSMMEEFGRSPDSSAGRPPMIAVAVATGIAEPAGSDGLAGSDSQAQTRRKFKPQFSGHDVTGCDSEYGGSSPRRPKRISSGTVSTEGRRPGRRARVGMEAFETLKMLGKGGFAKVVLVRHRSSGKVFAMKILKKRVVLARNQREHTKTERAVLGFVDHPFIVGLHCAFQTTESLFLVLDYCAGGELFFHLQRRRRFTEATTRFFAAQLVLALSYLHSKGVVYRDLKPENILVSADGYIKIADFGLSKEGVDPTSGSHSFCGTPEYLAPEIIEKRGHGTAVDWWSLGMLVFEMLTGLPPWYTKSRPKLYRDLCSAELEFPADVAVSPAARDLISGFLCRDPKRRLGTSGLREIVHHPFFGDPEYFRALLRKEVPPPITPNLPGGDTDTSYFEKEFTAMPVASPPTQPEGLCVAAATASDEALHFEGFTYHGASQGLCMPSSGSSAMGGPADGPVAGSATQAHAQAHAQAALRAMSPDFGAADSPCPAGMMSLALQGGAADPPLEGIRPPPTLASLVRSAHVRSPSPAMVPAGIRL
ncbi:hypothetical protein FNF31_03995 [Cafeteria roenbergensis]|uniref:Protein kinase domain-containing protein n=1 Tax=Cafeteria roenbergensis TaxID=33653 RepID=A0A5A8D9C4_CAFRO|nr:hypothetical protein FNF31_03995 [Cafeteria roenbergensis]KAA0170830.1 hypothetical protein FNF28_01103 [Cafeteria roenbergensis]